MADALPIPVADLLIDEENPRLGQPNVGQREALRELARLQQTKLMRLAEDIVRYGMNPADLPIVMPFDQRRYVVLEGNRRFVALKALENPDSMVGALTPWILSTLRKVSAVYQQNPIESINCLVVKDRDEARHWIELRHTGQNEGAGIVPWGSDESARFQARTGELEPHTQALDFLEMRGVLTADARRDVPAASFKRLIGTAEVRGKLGIDVKDKKLRLLANETKIAKALMYVVNDLISGNTSTKDIYHKPDRIKYANSLPQNVIIKPTKKGGPTLSPVPSSPQKKSKRTVAVLPRQRDRLIPSDCALQVTEPRIRRIEAELRTLSLENYTNAVSVLFRVFVELSCDAYVTKVGLTTTTAMDSLSKKLQDVSSDLVGRSKLTAEQARPVRRAATRDSFLAPSTTLLNGYVHNQYIFPAPGDLRAHWDSLQPFFTAIWTP